LLPGTYSVIVTDANGCTTTIPVTLNTASPVNINSTVFAPSCGQCDGIVNAVASGGNGPAYNYNWSPPYGTGLCEGIAYTLTVTDMNGCTGSSNYLEPAACDSVWPGDANSDGTADNNDVLSIGLSYNTTGAARAGASNLWTGQLCPAWADTLSNGINGKHQDCDGNGVVDASDTLAVTLNYGLTHPFRRPAVPYNSSIPDLYLVSIADTVGISQMLHVKVYLGRIGMPVSSIYGLTFTLTFDQTLVDTNTINLDFSTSALGTLGVDLLGFRHTDVVMTDNISTVNSMRLGITNSTANTHDGSVLAFNLIGDSVLVDPTFVGIGENISENQMVVYPTPASNELHVSSTSTIERAELVSATGMKSAMMKPGKKQFTFDVSQIPTGIYILKLYSSRGIILKKISIFRN